MNEQRILEILMAEPRVEIACHGAHQRAFVGSERTGPGGTTGECPECGTRQPCLADGEVMAHEWPGDEVARQQANARISRGV